jgi:two-component system, cell cycle sensor histidine kinase and response regulator CckA
MERKPTYEALEEKYRDLEKVLQRQKEVEFELHNRIGELEQIEKFYNALMENTEDYVVICDKNGVSQAFNATYKKVGEELLNIKLKPGIKPHELSGKPEIIKYWDSLQNRVLKGEQFAAEYHNEERNQYFETKFYPIREGQEITGFTEITREITAHKQMEKKLRDSDSFNSSLLENSPNAILVYNPDSSVRYVNPFFEKLTGYTSEEVLGTKVPYPWWVDDPEEYGTIEQRLQLGLHEPYRNERRYRKKNGDYFWVMMAVTPIFHNKEFSYSLSTWVDITDRKESEKEKEKLQNRLQQAQRMEAVGTLAGGLAHDYNNLLMGILGNVSLMLIDLESTHPLYDRLKDIEQYVQNGTDLTKQMLGFARGGKYEVKPTDMNELLKESSDMFGKTKKEITIHSKYQKDIWAVEVDRGQINQVLINLFVNAWQSMPGGGELYLETKNVVLDNNYMMPFNNIPGNYVRISVTDTGVGMDEATKKRIFEPFFTTKEMGRGTGLGLATVYGIIKNHSGIINVYSEIGVGSTFNIYLPVSDKIVTKEIKPSNNILMGDETILLVDDEAMIISVATRLLEKLGYNVLISKSGREAIEIYKKDNAKIDLVILDMIMPSIGGGETFDEIKKINPDLKVLLSSGYSLNGQAAAILQRGCNGFIQKPFNLKDLSHKIREILDKD